MKEDTFKEGSGNDSLEQQETILAENCDVSNLIIHVQSNKPAKQHVVIKMFHEKLFIADPVKAPGAAERAVLYRAQSTRGRFRHTGFQRTATSR